MKSNVIEVSTWILSGLTGIDQESPNYSISLDSTRIHSNNYT